MLLDVIGHTSKQVIEQAQGQAMAISWEQNAIDAVLCHEQVGILTLSFSPNFNKSTLLPLGWIQTKVYLSTTNFVQNYVLGFLSIFHKSWV